MSARDDLVDLITLGAVTRHSFGQIADAILKAGWRPPMREVSTVEELETLPDGAVMLDSGEKIWRWRDSRMWWDNEWWEMNDVLECGPFRVVWEPEVKA